MAAKIAEIFTDVDEARQYLEKQRWPDGPVCPHCGNVDQEAITSLKGKAHRPGVYQCNACRNQFTVTVGTVFERSKIPLNTWLYATYLLCSSKKGISSLSAAPHVGRHLQDGLVHDAPHSRGDDRSRHGSAWWQRQGCRGRRDISRPFAKTRAPRLLAAVPTSRRTSQAGGQSALSWHWSSVAATSACSMSRTLLPLTSATFWSATSAARANCTPTKAASTPKPERNSPITKP